MFTVHAVANNAGYAVYWKGVPFPAGTEIPWTDRAAARAYVKRLEDRYPDGCADALVGRGSTRQKGGPWRYLLLDGTTAVIHTPRKADAKALLQAQMRRKRLPNGIVWTLEV